MTEHAAADLAGPPTEMPQPRLGRRTGRTMVWGQVSKSLEALLTLAIAVAAVRALNPNAFGLYSLLTYIAGSASVLIPVVVVEAAGAVLPRVREARQRVSIFVVVAATRLVVIIVTTLATLPLWDLVRPLFGLDAISHRVFIVAAVYWAAQDVLNSVAGFYLVQLDLRPVALWRPVGQLVTLVAIIGVAATEDRWSSSVGEVLAAVAAGFLVTLGGLVWSLRAYGRPIAADPEELRAVLRLARTTWLIGVITFALATQIDVLLIGALTGLPQQVAFYVASVGILVRAQSVVLAGWLSPAIPALSRALIDGGRAGFSRAWELFAKLWLFVALPINVLLIAVGDPLLVSLFGDAYRPAGGLVVWAAAFNVALALAGGTLGTSALWALDRHGAVTVVKSATALANLALAVPLILEYRALGAVIATGIAVAVDAAVETVLAARYGGVVYPWSFAARVVAASAVVAVPAAVVRPGGIVEVALVGAAGIAAYLAVTLLLKPFSSDDLEVLSRASARLAASPLRRLARGAR
jgi:O-antigen/teichoic acid export membrane protein